MKLLILDRDGVINYNSDQYIKNPDEWRPLPGSLEAIAQLTQSGWRIAVATNQSGIARGLFSMETLNAMHAKMHKAVTQAGGRIEAVFYCPDSADSNSPRRKPNPGMLLSIAERFNAPLHAVPLVGDSLRDLQAAITVGAQPFLVLSGNGRKTRKKGGLPAGTRIFPDLAAVARELLH
ncbi:MAG: D-glycero-beta-D-manno-heptose 1,7-bisphosphate 7-phosphatase [Betaproteobacteria bacterium]|nr:D-glycero-beta-D-manno-heptose 1,7-bisphosphate 7-phosphatase [Betaproteobacteria bacterium]